MRSRIAVGIFVLAVVAALAPSLASAAPADRGAARPAHADVDGNGLSDALEQRLERIERGDGRNLVEVVVTWHGPVDPPAAQRAVGAFELVREFTIIDGFLARVTPGQARALARVAGVHRVEANFEARAVMDGADRDYGTEAARAAFGVTGAGVNACVLDTGADPGHEQLDSQVLGFHDAINARATAYDDHDHGTHVASILAGDGEGGPDAAALGGVAPDAGLYVAKVLDGAGSGTTAQIIEGIEWCVQQPGVRLLSMSLGTAAGSDGQDALSQAVDSAVTTHGMVVVVAAGNAGDATETVGAPGAAAQALTIGAASKHSTGLYLAPFSSRGPTLDGRLKPDTVAAGVAITAADANTAAGYATYSGTSMATPFAAGAVALALQADPTMTPGEVKTAVQANSTDLGVTGPDDNWGHGLLDGYGLVASAAGATVPAPALPTRVPLDGTVPDDGSVSHEIVVSPDQAGEPLAVTLLIEGELVCSFFWVICWGWEWSPDLDATLTAPDGTTHVSECPLAGICGTAGQQETFRVGAAQAGTWLLEVVPFAGDPNDGTGGAYLADVFLGAAGGGSPPPPPPDNTAPEAADDAHATSEDVVLQVAAPGVLANDEDTDGDPLTAAVATSPANGSLTLAADGSFSYTPDPDWFGTDTFTYVASDGNGGSDTATVTLTVDAVNDLPTADAGSDVTVVDADDSGTEQVTLDGSASFDVEGITAYSWSVGGSEVATGPTPGVAFEVGTHTVTLEVTDGDGATATDDVVVTVEPAPVEPPTGEPHVGDLDGVAVNLGRTWRAEVVVTVHDGDDVAMAGAQVSVTLGTGGTAACTTGGDGTCTVTSAEVRKNVHAVTFEVTAVATTDGYDAGANHDPDGDSDGTTITVTR